MLASMADTVTRMAAGFFSYKFAILVFRERNGRLFR
jgi:hypothetical protein